MERRFRALEKDNEALKGQNSQLKGENAKLKDENTDLQKKVVALEEGAVAENCRLKERILVMEQVVAARKIAHKDQVKAMDEKLRQSESERAALQRLFNTALDDLKGEREGNASLKDEVAALKSGAVVTDESYLASCNRFFDSPEWDDAQRDIMIIVGRELRNEVLEHHPGLDLSFLSDRIDIPTQDEKREQERGGGPSLPPIPEVEEAPPAAEAEGVVEARQGGPQVQGEASRQPEVEVPEANKEKDPPAVPSDGGIFGDCGSIEKI